MYIPFLYIYPVTIKLSDTEKLPVPPEKCKFITPSLNIVEICVIMRQCLETKNVA